MSFLTGPRIGSAIVEPRVDFENIPLTAIRAKTSGKLSNLLNSQKVLRTEDGYERDWCGIFTLTKMGQAERDLISQSSDQTKKLLELWNRSNKDNNLVVTVNQLREFLGIIDRYDVLDDTFELLVDDAKAYLSSLEKRSAKSSSCEIVQADQDNDIITQQDLEHQEKGLPLNKYDGLVLYHEHDVDFASDLITRLEEDCGYSLCVKDRDLIAGIPLESDAMARLIEKRCRRLIIIVSKAFLNSPMQIYLTNLAQTMGIEQNKRKIIPCLVEQCELPVMLRYSFRLDFWKSNKLVNFWEKLDQSMKESTRFRNSPENAVPRESLSEIDAAHANLRINIPQTPSPFYDSENVYKFTETPKLAEKPEQEAEEKKLIWPPAPRLRPSSSMMSLDKATNEPPKINNKMSQSSFYINQPADPAGLDAIKKKRKKWFSIFKPPSSRSALKENSIVEQPARAEREETNRKPWYKLEKKKKKKEKVALTA